MEAVRKLNKTRLVPYLFIGPAIIYLMIVTLIPALMAFPISLTDWTALSTKMNYVGFDNYAKLLTDKSFHQSLLVMAKFFISIPIIMGFGLITAMLVNNKLRGMTFFRVVFYSPVITSTIAAAVLFDYFFQPTFGLFNSILKLLGLRGIGWVYDANTAVMSVILFKVWRDAGAAMLIYLAGLQDIPQTLIEAANIDGATFFKRFRYITLPLLRPAHVYLLVTNIIHMFMIFQETYLFAPIAPLQSTRTVVNYIYERAFTHSEMGYASAMSFVLFAVIFCITLFQYRFLEMDFN